MIDLAIATKARFEADATLSALGTLYLDQQPATDGSGNPMVPPYARQSYIASSNENAFGEGKVENTQIQFTIYANLPTTLRTYYNAMLARFPQSLTSATMPVTDGTFMGVQRLNQFCAIAPEGVDRNGKPVYKALATYRFKINRTA